MDKSQTSRLAPVRSIAVAMFAGGLVSCSASNNADAEAMQWVLVLTIGFAAFSIGVVMLSLGCAIALGKFKDGAAPAELGSWQTTLVALYGVLVAGLFVFMSFRLDAGAREAAAEAASATAETVAVDTILPQLKRLQEISAQVAGGSLRVVPQQPPVAELTTDSQVSLSVDGQSMVWASFEPSEARNYRIDVFGYPPRSVDPIVYLHEISDEYTTDGITIVRVIAENDDGGENYDASLQRRLNASTQYYLGVTTFGEVDSGSVTIQITPA